MPLADNSDDQFEKGRNDEMDIENIFNDPILRCLCFYNPESDLTTDKLHKRSNVLNPLLTNFTNAKSPGKNLSLDEAMILSVEDCYLDNTLSISNINMV